MKYLRNVPDRETPHQAKGVIPAQLPFAMGEAAEHACVFYISDNIVGRQPKGQGQQPRPLCHQRWKQYLDLRPCLECPVRLCHSCLC